jgi:SAM-dependent methyltransferase
MATLLRSAGTAVNGAVWGCLNPPRWSNTLKGFGMRTPQAGGLAHLEPSNAMLKVVADFLPSTSGKILDMGCGYGRNSIALACRGHQVIAADNDFARLEALRESLKEDISLKDGSISFVKADLSSSRWPFKPHSFEGIISVHFPDYRAVRFAHHFLRRDGWLYFDSVGAQGKNYLQLPEQGWMKRVLRESFVFQHYAERHAGPRGQDAVAVRLLARRI